MNQLRIVIGLTLIHDGEPWEAQTAHTDQEITSAVEAIREALQHGMNRGFNHPLSDTLSLRIDNVSADSWEVK